jgi:hypothetical protein
MMSIFYYRRLQYVPKAGAMCINCRNQFYFDDINT